MTNGFGEAEAMSATASEAKILEPKEELQYLSEVLGFVVTFTDFPQKSAASKNSPEFITLVKLSTKPPKVSTKVKVWRKNLRRSCVGGGIFFLLENNNVHFIL